MQYQNICPAIFISRPNRFIAEVLIDGVPTRVHVKNTGRCRELLLPGAKVYLEKSTNPDRKTAYDLIAVEKGDLLINMDSQAPNKVVGEWLAGGGLFPFPSLIQPEKKDGNSRLDFYAEYENGTKKVFIEVKGCTLEENGTALFPDAPTERGVKHINHLAELAGQGYEAYIIIVIQMNRITDFRPNDRTHAAFGAALREAAAAGVKVLAFSCQVTPDSLSIDRPVPVIL